MKSRTSAPAARSAASMNRGSRFAAPGISDNDTAQANVVVQSAINLTMVDATFTLTGTPTTTQTEVSAIDFNVQTNNALGYAVTVQAAAANMVGTGLNADVIPTTSLRVKETGTAQAFTPLTVAGGGGAAVTVHSQATKSADAGDNISSDYQLVVPFVNEDTYTATLNYVATTL